MKVKDIWDLDTALSVVQDKTADAVLWAEAVEWLLLHGPPEIVSILLQASGHATSQCFPELQPAGFTHDGEPLYDIAEMARSLDIPEDEVRRLIAAKLRSRHLTQFFSDGGSTTVH